MAGGVQRSDGDQVLSVWEELSEEGGALVGGQGHIPDRTDGNLSVLHAVLLDLLRLDRTPAHTQAIRTRIRYHHGRRTEPLWEE